MGRAGEFHCVSAQRSTLLIVEDDRGLQKQLKWCFDEFDVVLASNRTEALAQLRRHEPPVVIQDLGLPPDLAGDTEGLSALSEILAAAPSTKVIVITGNNAHESGLKAIDAGAYDFYEKPLEAQLLKVMVGRALHVHALERRAREWRAAKHSTPLEGIIATDESMLAVCRMIEKVAPTGVSVLLLGESGTGKELLARALHDLGGRRGPFVPINCASIPAQLIESELFGHERGAFTGAVRQSIGKFEGADHGTLFLDEVGDMPPELQPKLLRFLQSRVLERVGGRQLIPVDVRIVCATNKNIQQLIDGHQFREDLYYRIAEVTITVPPLRARAGGAVALAHAILRRNTSAQQRGKRAFTEEAMAAIDAFAWPGNVRELESRIKTALIMSENALLTAADLGIAVQSTPVLNLQAVRARAERQAIRQALQMSEGQTSKTAELLGISPPALEELMERYELRGTPT
jgi:two-component system, NtrC family, response regulator